MQRLISIIFLMFFLCATVLLSVQNLCAQEPSALGEMRSYGDVFIRSSTGEWMPAPATYPILQNTAISTGKGSALLYYKDGSRISLSESTMAVVDGTNADYTVHLAKGSLAVNSSPKASMIVKNGSTDVYINANPAESHNQSQRFLGTVYSKDTGIEMNSIVGASAVKVNATETKVIPSGQGIFIGSDNTQKTYATSQTYVRSKGCPKPKHPKKNASPYYFDDDRDEDFCTD